MKQKQVLKRALIVLSLIILMILVIFWGNMLRKHLIIQKIRRKIAEYQTSENYHVRITNRFDDENNQTDLLKKGDFEVSKSNEITDDDSTSFMYCYRNLKTGIMNIYHGYQENKTAIIGQKNDINFVIFDDYFDIKDRLNYFRFLANVKIGSKEFKGKNCYHIDIKKCLKYMEDMVGDFLLEEGESLDDNDFELDIEKNTGLTIYNSIMQRECEYEFDVVTDEDLVEPDNSEYNTIYLSMTEEDYHKYNEGNLSLRITGWSHGYSNGEEEFGLTFRVYEQVPDDTLEGEIGRFVGQNINFSIKVDKKMKCQLGNEERTIAEEYQINMESGTLRGYGDEEIFPLLNDELVFEDGELVSIIFSNT